MATKKQTTKKSKGLSTEQKLGLGVGLTAAAAAAAGAYFLYGSKDAKKNRKQVKSWALKAKAEVLERLEQVESITEREFDELVAAAAATYSSAKSVTKKDVKEFQSEMAENWQDLLASGVAKVVEVNSKKSKKPVQKKTAKKTAKQKVSKKTVKKAAKKATSKRVKRS